MRARHIIFSIIFLGLCFFHPIYYAHAEDNSPVSFNFLDELLINGQPIGNVFPNVGSVITLIVTYLVAGAALLFFALIFVNGYKIVFQADKEKSLSEAKQYLTIGLMGLAIVATAYWITLIVYKITGYSS